MTRVFENELCCGFVLKGGNFPAIEEIRRSRSVFRHAADIAADLETGRRLEGYDRGRRLHRHRGGQVGRNRWAGEHQQWSRHQNFVGSSSTPPTSAWIKLARTVENNAGLPIGCSSAATIIKSNEATKHQHYGDYRRIEPCVGKQTFDKRGLSTRG
jgi:hypothetical protein